MLQAGSKPASVNVWLSGVRAFFAWANEYGRMADNPAAKVKGAKRAGTATTHKRDSLTDAEAVRLLDLKLPARDRAIIALFLFCGLRQVEIERADVQDIGTRDGAKVLYVQGKGRTTKDEFVIIAGEAEQALAAWLTERAELTTAHSGPLFISFSDKSKGGRLGLRGIRDVVKNAMQAAGIVGERKTTHSLRHTAISSVLKNGGTLQQAQAMARHSNISTTGIYVHDLDRVANAGERLVNYRRKKS
jgi:site-specific recombinase XerD